MDDDAKARKLLNDFLTRQGFAVKAVEDGLDVLVFLKYHRPDLIISDIRMPKCDGITLLQGLKNRVETRNIPVIFISGYDNKEIINKAAALGAKNFLMKPFSLKKMLEVINEVFEPEEDIPIEQATDSE